MTNDRPHRSLGVWLIIAGLLSPVAYVLSMGPTAWLMTRGYISDPTYQAIYTPLRYLGRHYGPIADAMESYIAWWLGE
jgi:hypothetical protein